MTFGQQKTEHVSLCGARGSKYLMCTDPSETGCSHIGKLHAGWLPMNTLEAQQGGRMLVEGQYSCADMIKAQEAFPT